MKLTTSEQIICELHTMGAINEQSGYTGKEIADLMDNHKASARLTELRKAGYVKSSDRSTGAMRFWLTPAGETYAIELKHYASESKHDQENNTSENNELNDSTLINEATSQENSVEEPVKCTQITDALRPAALYTFDDANETWETLTDAITAARDYVEKHGHMVIVFTTRNIAAVSPIVASQVEYL